MDEQQGIDVTNKPGEKKVKDNSSNSKHDCEPVSKTSVVDISATPGSLNHKGEMKKEQFLGTKITVSENDQVVTTGRCAFCLVSL